MRGAGGEHHLQAGRESVVSARVCYEERDMRGGEVDGLGWGKRPHRIRALLVLPGDTAREPRRQERGYGFGCLHREQERGIPVRILADAVVFVAGFNEEFLTPVISALLLVLPL